MSEVKTARYTYSIKSDTGYSSASKGIVTVPQHIAVEGVLNGYICPHKAAASGELLEALEFLIVEADPLKLNTGEPWCRVRAAIAKAKGEQQ